MSEQNQEEKQVAKKEINLNAPVVLTVTDKALAELKKLKDLKILDVNDKKGYDEVYKARQLVKRTRTGVKAEADAMKETALAWQRKVNSELKRVTDELTPIEDHLQAEEDRYLNAKELLKKEEAENRRAALQLRIDALAAVNYKVGIAFIEGLDDNQYENILKDATERFEQDKIAARERAEQEARDRAELEELRKKKADLEAQEARLAEQEKKRLEQRYEDRTIRLLNLGMTYDVRSKSFTFDVLKITVEAIQNSEDTLFADIEADFRDSIKRIKDNREKIRIEEAAAAEAKAKADAEAAAEKAKKDAIEAEARAKAAAKAAADKAVAEEKARIEAEKKAAAERIAAASDAEKIADLLLLFNGLKIHEMKSVKGKAITSKVTGLINDIREVLKTGI